MSPGSTSSRSVTVNVPPAGVLGAEVSAHGLGCGLLGAGTMSKSVICDGAPVALS